MRALRIFIGLLTVLIMMPISLWLQYQILKRVDASELMFFLYWVNVPLAIFVALIGKLLEKSDG